MRVYRSAKQATGELRDPAVAIGNFDGVHRGHQALFAKAKQLARQGGGEAVALTFDPHPARFFNPDLAPPLITTERQKLELLESCGLDAVVIEPFDSSFAALTPADFCRQIVHRSLRARHVVVGKGFVFGAKRAGTVETLVDLGQALGFTAHALDTVRVCSITASSTKVREFLLLGRVGGASLLLGRDYLVEGKVVAGRARGRSIGIPTANILAENEILPRKGVYAGWACLPQGPILQAVINIGTNPTFEQAATLSLEVHVLDFSEDLYGQRLGVLFTQRLREEQRFSSVAELLQAIEADITDARALLRSPARTIELESGESVEG